MCFDRAPNCSDDLQTNSTVVLRFMPRSNRGSEMGLDRVTIMACEARVLLFNISGRRPDEVGRVRIASRRGARGPAGRPRRAPGWKWNGIVGVARGASRTFLCLWRGRRFGELITGRKLGADSFVQYAGDQWCSYIVGRVTRDRR